MDQLHMSMLWYIFWRHSRAQGAESEKQAGLINLLTWRNISDEYQRTIKEKRERKSKVEKKDKSRKGRRNILERIKKKKFIKRNESIAKVGTLERKCENNA